MPIIGRYPAIFVLDTGEVGVLLSEHAQRNRGICRFYRFVDPDSGLGPAAFLCPETPWAQERLLWFSESISGVHESFTPVIVRDRDTVSGASPHIVHYLRNVIDPHVTYNNVTQEVLVWWWENRFTPIPSLLDPLSGDVTFTLNSISRKVFLSTEDSDHIQDTISDVLTFLYGLEFAVEVQTVTAFSYVVNTVLEPQSLEISVGSTFYGEIILSWEGSGKLLIVFKRLENPFQLEPDRDTPTGAGLTVPPSEPHSSAVTQYGAARHEVGDPPTHTPAGVFNRFSLDKTLNAGGTAEGKLRDPLQEEGHHLSLPPIPGYVSMETIQDRGNLVSFRNLAESDQQSHTNHLYMQREVQALGVSTRTLMLATGKIELLTVTEEFSSARGEAFFGQLRLSLEDLRPGIQWVVYAGDNRLEAIDSEIVAVPGLGLPGYFLLTQGEIGQVLLPLGGTPPFSFGLRQLGGTDIVRDASDYSDPVTGDLLPNANQVLQGGGVPAGLFLHSSGFFYGRPDVSGSFLFRVQITDAQGVGIEKTLHIEILGGIYGSEEPTTQLPCEIPDTVDSPLRIELDSEFVVDSGEEAIFVLHPEVVNGTGPYVWSIEGEGIPPSGLTLDTTTGRIGLESETVSNSPGVWAFQIQVTDTSTGLCTRKVLTLVLGVPAITCGSVQTDTSGIPIPEAESTQHSATYLVLDYPTPVSSENSGENTVLGGSAPYSLAGFNSAVLDPSPITSLVPGMQFNASLLRAIPQATYTGNPALDWTTSNPCDFFDLVDDREDPYAGEPPEPEPSLPDLRNQTEVQTITFTVVPSLNGSGTFKIKLFTGAISGGPLIDVKTEPISYAEGIDPIYFAEQIQLAIRQAASTPIAMNLSSTYAAQFRAVVVNPSTDGSYLLTTLESSPDLSVLAAAAIPGKVSIRRITGNLQQLQFLGSSVYGSYHVRYQDMVAGPLLYDETEVNASVTVLQTALDTILGVGNSTVTGISNSSVAVNFIGDLANTDVDTLEIVPGEDLNATVSVVESTKGLGYVDVAENYANIDAMTPVGKRIRPLWPV